MSTPLTIEELRHGAATFAGDFLERSGETLRAASPEPETTESQALSRLGTQGVTLLGTLGAGGMAVVRLGLQESVDREVAVKTLRGEAPSTEARQHLLREAWITGGLEHPNIVPVHDVRADEQGAPQILLKRIDGRAWSELLADPSLLAPYLQGQEPIQWHVRTLIAVCNAVDFAHSRGVLHRDIKPDNVMVGAFGEVTLLDWGIAARLDPEKGVVLPPKGTGQLVGTPAYLAPEMVGRRSHTPATDVYLLGAVLCELITGAPPHRGDSLEEMLAGLLSPPALPDHPLSPLCARAMSVSPSGRPAVPAFRRELERFLELGAARDILAAAEERFAELQRSVSHEADEHEVLALMSACLFGFTQAAEAAPELVVARQRLDELAHVAARWALGRGEPQVASFHLSRAREVDPELQREVQAALEERAGQQARLAALIAERDPSVGLRARRYTGLLVMALAGGFSLLMSQVEGGPSYAQFAATSLVISAVMMGVAWWRRASLQREGFNRHLVTMAVLVPLLQTVVDLGAWLRGWPPEQAHSALFVVMMTALLLVGLTTGTRLAAVGLVWIAGWLLSAMWPSEVYVFHGLAAAASVGLTVALWPTAPGDKSVAQSSGSNSSITKNSSSKE